MRTTYCAPKQSLSVNAISACRPRTVKTFVCVGEVQPFACTSLVPPDKCGLALCHDFLPRFDPPVIWQIDIFINTYQYRYLFAELNIALAHTLYHGYLQ